MRAKRNLGIERTEKSLAAQADLEKAGLDLPAKPEVDYPELPSRSLVELPDKALMDTFQEFVEWADYVAGQMAIAEIEERLCETMIRRIEAEAIVRNRPEKASEAVTWAKAEKELDPTFQEWLDKLDVIYAYRKMVSVLVESLERDAQLLSREITRRVGHEPKARRVQRWKP